ncbi:SRPBCC family protein [Natronorarus salvus]|uniref:SRPBCC family protein n=1 Tax=Natronorarus salvus TaxID=3117733 RepID=UPI002F260629
MSVTMVGRTTIDAPVTEVFSFMDDPENHVRVTPSLRSVEGIERVENGGKRAAFDYRILGVPFRGELRDSAYDPPNRMVHDLSGTVSGRITETFESNGSVTEYEYRAEYDLHRFGPLGRLLRPLFVRYNRHELERLLTNVRSQFE